ncbi:MAG: hypothetical protein PHU51_06310 [Candidatus Nanoarchaeia archaeon]|nr:hypothetical protein [Candidatus Nanoarchaeia archaeon]
MKTKTKIGWKVLLKGMKSQYGDFKWKKGQWYKHEGNVSVCNSGFHASKNFVDAMNFVTPGILAKVEYRGNIKEAEDKFVASEMRVLETYRFTKRHAVEWSIYCARECLKNFEKYNKTDKRPREAIEAAEIWLKTPTKKNQEAASSASSAARSAAWSAAESAESAARSAAESARSAAWSAAESAAWSAAWSARSAAKIKLHKKLLKIIGAK